MKDGSIQLQLVRTLFANLLEKLQEQLHNAIRDHHDEKLFTTLQFQVDHYCWFYAHQIDTIKMEEFCFDRPGDKPINASCSMSTDAATMLKVCRGDMSFPSAYLSGKVKFHGDKKVMKAISIPIKDALESLKRIRNEYESSERNNLSSRNSLQSDSTTDEHQHQQLTARIVEAFAPNFKYNIEDASANKTAQGVSKDVAVRYRIQVSFLHSATDSWTVAHRYSHFLKLRAELVEQGFRGIPTITSRNSLFNSIDRVVHSRIVNLGFFISECLSQVGAHNDTLNQFLARPAHQTNNNSAHNAEPSLSSFLHSNLHPHDTHHNTNPNNQNTTSNETDRAVHEALEHAWGSRITWAHRDLHHSRFLIKELASQRRVIDALHKDNSTHASNIIVSVLHNIRTYLLVLVCALISAYFYERSHIEPGHTANVYIDVVLKLALLLLLRFPRTRYYTLFYCVVWLVTINTGLVSFTLVNNVVNKYSEHWTMYKSHIKWLAIPNSVVMVPEVFRLPPSVTHILRDALPDTLYDVSVGGVLVVYAAVRSVVVDCVGMYDSVWSVVIDIVFTPGAISAHNTTQALLSIDVVLCTILALYTLLAYILSSDGICRAVWIYSLGMFLITIYATLQILCVVLRLPATISDALFAQVDAVMAPFVVSQIGQLRSVFVKFAQYFGGRSDVVSPLWTDMLSHLQDACPASSATYVRSTIETQLGEIFSNLDNTTSTTSPTNTTNTTTTNTTTNITPKPFKLEDVFDHFDLSPIASASIGQVHTATLKHAALVKILHLQSSAGSGDVSDGVGGSKDSGVHTTHSTPANIAESTINDAMNTNGSGTDNITPEHAPSVLSPTSTANNTTTPSTHATTQPTLNSTDPTTTNPTNPNTTHTAQDEQAWYERSTDPDFTTTTDHSELVSVVVKVQHEGIGPLMVADMGIVLVLIKWASFFDTRWETMLQVMRSWDLTMRGELDYRQEADNLREMKGIMGQSGLGAATPIPVPGLASTKVLVMTRLFGYKVTDKPALILHNVNREALLSRLAHCSAYQLLVAGVFNADPHAGNILFCLFTKDSPSYTTDAEQDTYPHDPTSTPTHSTHSTRAAAFFSASRSSVAGSVVGDDASVRESVLDSPPRRAPQSQSRGGNSVTFQRTRGGDSDDGVSETGSVASGKAASVASTNSYARHIYDATPGKSLGTTRSSASAIAGTGNSGISGPTAPSTGSVVSGQSATTDHTVRRMIYDATPAKGVGFASDVSTYSAEFSPAASSLAPTPSVAAGHTPHPRGGPPLTPRSTATSHLKRVFSEGNMNHDASFTTQVEEAVVPDIIPGLLDFGMTVRLSPERRRTYCRLIIALCDGDLKTAAAELRAVGYTSNQSDRAPERDAEFFEHLFRDANPRGVSKQERDDFNAKRTQQREADIAAGTREKGGRSIAQVPDDFLFLTRLVGLLRGLTSELDASCPILYILALNARIGLLRDD